MGTLLQFPRKPRATLAEIACAQKREAMTLRLKVEQNSGFFDGFMAEAKAQEEFNDMMLTFAENM